MLRSYLIFLLVATSGSAAFAGSANFGVQCRGLDGVKAEISSEGCDNYFQLNFPAHGKVENVRLTTNCQSKPEDMFNIAQNAVSNFVSVVAPERIEASGKTDALILNSSSLKFKIKSKNNDVERYSFRGRVTHFYRRNGDKFSRSYDVLCEAQSVFDF